MELLEGRELLSLTPRLVLDINANTSSADIREIVAVGSSAFFTAWDGVHGAELWKSDGTAPGTAMVKDINPDSTALGPGNLTDVDGTLYFAAENGTGGRELWKSDGTPAGTVMVKDIKPGGAGSEPMGLVNVNGTLFFSADDGVRGRELWKSDGTPAGTVRLSQLSLNPVNLTSVNGTLFFALDDGSGSGWNELWKSDGTAAGTVLVSSAASRPGNLTNVNGTLFFSAYDLPTGYELWKSDGTAAGTTLVNDIFPGGYGSYPSNLTSVNGTLLFSAFHPHTGTELWKSDGTAAGTTLVKDVFPGTYYTYYGGPFANRSNPTGLTNVDGTLFFAATDELHGTELWKSDGTAAGTVLVKDVFSTPSASWGSNPSALTNVNGVLFFAATTDSNGRELWKSDGTAAGTALVKDIYRGSDPWIERDPRNLTNVNGLLFLSAHDGKHGYELWTSDGTAAGTTISKDVNNFTYGALPVLGSKADVDGTLFFTADDGTHGRELWKSDGTAAGTTLVKDIYPGGSSGGFGEYFLHSSSPSFLTSVNGSLFFLAIGPEGYGLWRSDGTEAGTFLVKHIDTGPFGSSDIELTNVDGTLFFKAYDDVHGMELWKSDGTAAGTTLVNDIYPGGHAGYYGYYLHSSDPSKLTNVDGTLYFSAYDGVNGIELWKSDGTTAGTVMVADISPIMSSYPTNLTNVNGTLFFTAVLTGDGHTTGVELWKSDGTAAGTVLVKDVVPGSGQSDPMHLTNVNGTLFFSADDGTNGRELWKSDGTSAGTVMVKDIQQDRYGGSYPSELMSVNGTLFFSADDGTNGRELWKSDGTSSGTVLVKNIHPDPDSGSSPRNLTSVNGTLFFSADDGTNGGLLWRSDGTPAGTVVVMDSFGAIEALTSVNGTLLFTHEDGIHGWELWTLVEDRPPTPPSLTISDVTLAEGNTGTRVASFTVTLSAPSNQAVTVNYATANGTATTRSDYAALSGTLTFLPGEISKTITVFTLGDRVGELDETFLVNLSSPTNATIAHGQAIGTILDDEPRIGIGDVTMKEGRKGTTTLFTFTVTLSAAYDLPVTVSFRTLNGTAKAGGGDYVAKSGTLTFRPGETTKTITVEVKGDDKRETDESFYLDLSNNSSNSWLTKRRGTGTILDDDSRLTKSRRKSRS